MYVLNNYDTIYRNYIAKDIREFKVSCTVDNSRLSESQISTFYLEYDLVKGSDEYSFGNLATTKLNITFRSDVDVSEDSKIVLTSSLKVIDDYNIERWLDIPLGGFRVHTITENKISKKVVAYDELYKEVLTRKYTSELVYEGSLLEVSIKDIIDELCGMRYLDIDYYDEMIYYNTSVRRPAIVNEKILRDDGKYEVVESDSNQVCLGMTVGQALGYMASYLGGNFIIDGNQKLKLIKHTEEPSFTYNTNRYNIDSKGKAVYNLTRIDCTTYEGNIITVGSGDESTSMKMENPFMDETRLANLLDEISNFSYSPISIKAVGDPTIQPGDVIRLLTDSETIIVPVMRMKLLFSGGCFNEVEAVCLTSSEKSYNYKGTLAQKIDDMNNTVTSVSAEIDRINESLTKLETVRDSVVEMDEYMSTLSTELTYSKKTQYELLLDKILRNDAEFASRYSAVVANKYLG